MHEPEGEMERNEGHWAISGSTGGVREDGVGDAPGMVDMVDMAGTGAAIAFTAPG
jgi:hypothetical protein